MRLLLTIAATALLYGSSTLAAEPFQIQVIDDATGRGVPLVELTTVNDVRYITDSAGNIAYDDISLMGQKVYFFVKSHGYEYPADQFGYRGKSFLTKPGGKATIKLKRINIAERLYRMTGSGIYRDSVMLGEKPPTDHPLLNGRVTGSDSVVNTIYNGRLYWFWSDTNLPKYPLGNFHAPGATSALPNEGGLDPRVGVNLEYFVDDQGYAKKTCEMPGEGPTWIDGLTTLKDEAGKERLLAHYVKVTQAMVMHTRGIAEFNASKNQFEMVKEFKLKELHPTGHPVHVTDDGVGYLYFAHPFPYTRVRATMEAFLDQSQYEAYTCLKATKDPKSPEVIRNAQGEAEYKWRREGVPMNHNLSKDLVKQGKLKANEAVFQLRDRETGKPLQAHGGSLAWNEYRQKWVMIVLETFGTSFLGEIWYAEADTPLGPWGDAVKIVTHDNYSFYNPKQHPYFDQDGGRYIYFEGTYTHTFTDNPDQTPRYDYNQIMYRLDLKDERL
ncbi:MAG: hypothetical protein HON04_18105 [Planctomicrobium sp.]|nr:hypothetical protein [Planctomicrobium sp.]